MTMGAWGWGYGGMGRCWEGRGVGTEGWGRGLRKGRANVGGVNPQLVSQTPHWSRDGWLGGGVGRGGNDLIISLQELPERGVVNFNPLHSQCIRSSNLCLYLL